MKILKKSQLNNVTKKTMTKSGIRLNTKQNYNQGDKSKIKIQKVKDKLKRRKRSK